MSDINIVYASTDADVILVHRFLCMTSAPQLMVPIDPLKSVTEVNRLVKDPSAGFVLMAIHEGRLVGVFGVMATSWWYGHGDFLVDRFFFVIDAMHNKGVGKMLEAEALKVAQALNVPLVIHGKTRRKGAAHIQVPRTYEPV
jgi:GNAT superfamily N-acetyltransferase